MADAQVVDYYAVLNLPSDADLTGIENAYARISDELAVLGDIDDECRAALQKVNEAYSVLSKPELRRSYDSVFLAAPRALQQRRIESEVRRRIWAQRAIIAALLVIVIAQAGMLAYLGWDQVSHILSTVLGPLWPGSASG